MKVFVSSLSDVLKRPLTQFLPPSLPSLCSVWNDHHHRTGYCVRHDRDVWRPFRDGCRDMLAHYYSG